jgi:hypothetical protein
MNQKIAYLDSQNQHVQVMNQKIAYLDSQNQQIQILNQKIGSLENQINQSFNQILLPMIPQVQQVQSLNSSTTIALKGSEGIFKFLETQSGPNLEVTCSSFYSDRKPQNVLSDDDNYWTSKTGSNEHITFHFLKDKINVESYLIRMWHPSEQYNPASLTNWSILGSIDGNQFTTIETRSENLNFCDGSVHIYDCPNNQFYNFIRFTFNSSGYYVRISKIELAGKLSKI